MKNFFSKSKTTLLVTTLLASSLVGCFGGDNGGDKLDISALRVQCEEASGFTGKADYFPGGVFIWRADNAEVAECEWTDGTFKYLGILGHSHAGDTP